MLRIYCTMARAVPRSQCPYSVCRYATRSAIWSDREFVLKSRHLGASHLDDVDHPLVIRRDTAARVVLPEQPACWGRAGRACWG